MIAATRPTVRAEQQADEAAIRALLHAAFGRSMEADLVDQLRDEGSAVLSLVAKEEGRIAGHVFYSRLTIDGVASGVCALAPVGVIPPYQRQGIGSTLIQAAHAELAARGEKLVLVVGEPDYYRRFGFSADRAKSFRTPYDGEYLMALVLAADAPTSGTVVYPAPFARLG